MTTALKDPRAGTPAAPPAPYAWLEPGDRAALDIMLLKTLTQQPDGWWHAPPTPAGGLVAIANGIVDRLVVAGLIAVTKERVGEAAVTVARILDAGRLAASP